jgi:hypothetical protein
MAESNKFEITATEFQMFFANPTEGWIDKMRTRCLESDETDADKKMVLKKLDKLSKQALQ